MRPREREALLDWEQYRKATAKATTIDLFESEEEQRARVKQLSADFPAFAKHYFPHFTTADFSKAQKALFREVLRPHKGNRVLANIIHRDGAKSATAMMLLLYMMCTGRMRTMLLTSWNEASAINLLTPFRLQLEANERLKHDFGPFQGSGMWEQGKFTTLTGCSFRALGSGQSPRGAKNEESRPDVILVDDFDEDEQSRNKQRVANAFDWLMGALFPAMSVTGNGIMLVTGNIIAPNTVLQRVEAIADWHQRVNLLDSQGNPTWPERFTKEECQYMVEKLGYRLSQREYFNNPIVEGTCFKKEWMPWAKMLPLGRYRQLLAYLDPGFKKTKTSDTKAWILVGLHEGKYHVIRPYVGQASIREMIAWGYHIKELCDKAGAAVTLKMEEVFLQDLLYDDFAAEGQARGVPLPVSGDKRKKPEKDARIAAMAGHFERGQVLFNQDLKEDAHMRELIEQLINFEPGVRTRKDGPDALEGAMHLLQLAATTAAPMAIGPRRANKYSV